ncbi:hypothetical protein D8Y22_15810 [Salinadaptatus halalkaliphilus]|uniref:Small CPxCG-related zinc finger protein n=1 Tax=Salinadaptatus halalkaliphilus TaxID=2419781 RepID=A0A4S3TIC7_9EURY|nr:DUF6276 family protein [Salinadaptatus halalkaliphilus]THE63804.1 hypothetical protein D8Y22_15810 [Salinadaptatus halalkaliphilus]
MSCPVCESSPIPFSVPDQYREHVADGGATVAFCPRCLTLEPTASESPSTGKPDFGRVSDAFPTNPDRAIALAIVLDLSSSLATNRAAIESLLRDVERAGTDPLLVIDRLVADPGVDPAMDLERRLHQLEQLLY